MKGTRLWTRAGSPLIHGRMGRQVSVYVSWSWGTIISAVVAFAGAYAFLHAKGSADAGTMLALALPLVGGVVLGAFAGAWVATRMGSLRAWVSSTLCGVAVSWTLAAAYFLWSIQASGV